MGCDRRKKGKKYMSIYVENKENIEMVEERVKRAWAFTDESTKKANDYSIIQYVVNGDFERDAFECWYYELEAPYDIEDIANAVHDIAMIRDTYLEWNE